MDELEWLAGSDAAVMLDYIQGQASERKLRLFACACVRRLWSLLLQYRTPRDAVALAERLAEGQAIVTEVEQVRQQAEYFAGTAPEFDQFAYYAAAATLAEQAADAARNAREFARQQAARSAAFELIPGENEALAIVHAYEVEGRAQVEMLNEIFGNPFRPLLIQPHWLTWSGGAVLAVAREIDAEQRFDEMPYLADALMDAGCTNDALLRHLRQRLGHLRGCWALDALLGR